MGTILITKDSRVIATNCDIMVTAFDSESQEQVDVMITGDAKEFFKGLEECAVRTQIEYNLSHSKIAEFMDAQNLKAYKRGVIKWSEACRREYQRQSMLCNDENALMCATEATANE